MPTITDSFGRPIKFLGAFPKEEPVNIQDLIMSPARVEDLLFLLREDHNIHMKKRGGDRWFVYWLMEQTDAPGNFDVRHEFDSPIFTDALRHALKIIQIEAAASTSKPG